MRPGSHLPASNTSKPASPDLSLSLKGVEVNHQVWAADITYIPMAKGFLSWWPSWTGTAGSAGLEALQHHGRFCVAALEEALGKERPEIFNTDQGSQFTFYPTLQEQRVQVSMDGKGRYWTTSSWKHQVRGLKAYQTVAEARTGINAYLSSTTGRGLRLWVTGPQQRCTNMARKKGEQQLKKQGCHRAW